MVPGAQARHRKESTFLKFRHRSQLSSSLDTDQAESLRIFSPQFPGWLSCELPGTKYVLISGSIVQLYIYQVWKVDVHVPVKIKSCDLSAVPGIKKRERWSRLVFLFDNRFLV